MNATSLEKQKKGNLYVYKLGAGSKTPEYQPPTAAAVTKRIISSSVWGLRKFKAKAKANVDVDKEEEKDKERERERERDKGGGIAGKGNDEKFVKEKEWETRERVSHGIGRKSVSSVEAILLSLASNVDSMELGKGKGFPFPEEDNKGKRDQDGRKSVSHVENNMAYVGKFKGIEKPRKSTGGKFQSNINSDSVSSIALFQVKVLVTDMPAFMQIHAFQCARNTYDSMEIFSARHLASNLKKEFDKVYGPAWHCIVGSSFGSFVTHATGCFLYFSMEKLCILLFRTKVQRALQ